MPRHGQDRSREYATASATATPVDKGAAARSPVDTTRRPRTHVDGAGPTKKGLLRELTAVDLRARRTPAARHDHAGEGVVTGARGNIFAGVGLGEEALDLAPHEDGLNGSDNERAVHEGGRPVQGVHLKV